MEWRRANGAIQSVPPLTGIQSVSNLRCFFAECAHGLRDYFLFFDSYTFIDIRSRHLRLSGSVHFSLSQEGLQ
jgi:hypothetical protein